MGVFITGVGMLIIYIVYILMAHLTGALQLEITVRLPLPLIVVGIFMSEMGVVSYIVLILVEQSSGFPKLGGLLTLPRP